MVAKFESGQQPFGKYLWNVQFQLGISKDEKRELVFGIYDSRAGVWIQQWSGNSLEEALSVIKSIMDKGAFKAVTVLPTEPFENGHIAFFPDSEVQTTQIDAATLNILRECVEKIKTTLREECRECQVLRTIGKVCDKHQ